jgi:hypothetical protein
MPRFSRKAKPAAAAARKKKSKNDRNEQNKDKSEISSPRPSSGAPRRRLGAPPPKPERKPERISLSNHSPAGSDASSSDDDDDMDDGNNSDGPIRNMVNVRRRASAVSSGAESDGHGEDMTRSDSSDGMTAVLQLQLQLATSRRRATRP